MQKATFNFDQMQVDKVSFPGIKLLLILLLYSTTFYSLAKVGHKLQKHSCKLSLWPLSTTLHFIDIYHWLPSLDLVYKCFCWDEQFAQSLRTTLREMPVLMEKQPENTADTENLRQRHNITGISADWATFVACEKGSADFFTF